MDFLLTMLKFLQYFLVSVVRVFIKRWIGILNAVSVPKMRTSQDDNYLSKHQIEDYYVWARSLSDKFNPNFDQFQA